MIENIGIIHGEAIIEVIGLQIALLVQHSLTYLPHHLNCHFVLLLPLLAVENIHQKVQVLEKLASRRLFEVNFQQIFLVIVNCLCWLFHFL